jgi:hypothetical protein
VSRSGGSLRAAGHPAKKYTWEAVSPIQTTGCVATLSLLIAPSVAGAGESELFPEGATALELPLSRGPGVAGSLGDGEEYVPSLQVWDAGMHEPPQGIPFLQLRAMPGAAKVASATAIARCRSRLATLSACRLTCV